MKLIMLIDAKMPTVVGILPFITTIKPTSENLKAGKVFIVQHFSSYKQLKCYTLLDPCEEKILDPPMTLHSWGHG